MAALLLMTVLSVVIGRLFNSVPAQFQTTVPLGEYAAVELLTFSALNLIRIAWAYPLDTNSKENAELEELVEAEELVKEMVGID
ncbi:hypothetical protein Cni_G24180 [Canna indica]|uniref:Uncharacterized protein n=1 Tax=Canna indica TaxID=4628 RepID=A0AAQ3KV83_9LILI|nr:hypothetical protein Cni_G24180 [Canna indica]